MFHFRTLIPTMLVGVLLLGCTAIVAPTDEPQTGTEPEQVSTEPSALANVDIQSQTDANNQFGFDLLHTLQQEQGEQNIFFSPLSLSLVLQMVYNGAVGDTAQDMAATLHLDEAPLDVTNAASAQLQADLTSAQDIELLVGNSIWLRDGVVLSPDYLNRVLSTFSAQIEALDFSDPQSVETINNWVANQTQGAIPKIVDNISPDIMLYLVNAVYFKGAWETPFNPSMTHSRPFHLASGEERQIDMMTQDADFLYYQDDRMSAAALPYAGNRLQMIIVLPSADISVAELAAGLDYDAWQAITSSLSQSRLMLSLPRFEVEYESTMNEALIAMGMQRPFDLANADFSNMVEGNGLFISEVIHKAIVKVDEEGTVAAAASGVAMATSMPPEFTVDRPFLLAIHDTQTGAILFMGLVYEPQPIS